MKTTLSFFACWILMFISITTNAITLGANPWMSAEMPELESDTIDSSIARWSETAIMPYSVPARMDAVAFALEDYILTGLGRSIVNVGETFNDLYKVDYANFHVTPLPDFPASSRSHAAYTVFEGDAYILGGQYYTNQSQPLNDFWKFDTGTETWTELAPFPNTITSGVLFALGNTLYAGLGGESDMYRYDAEVNAWIAMSNFAGNRYGATVFVYNDEAYITCGSLTTSYFYDDLHRFDPVTETWTDLGDPFDGFSGVNMCAFNLGDKMLLGYSQYNNYTWGGLLLDMETLEVTTAPEVGYWIKQRPAYCQKGKECYMLFANVHAIIGFEDCLLTVTEQDGTMPYSGSGKVINTFSEDNCGVEFSINVGPLTGFGVGANLREVKHTFLQYSSDYYDFYVEDQVYDLSDENADIRLPASQKYECKWVHTEESCADTIHFELEAVCNFEKSFIGMVDWEPRMDFAMIGHESGVYAGLGTNTEYEYLHDWYRIDPASGQLTALATFPSLGRIKCALFTHGDLIYIVGGEREDNGQPENDTNEMWAYNTAEDTWIQMTSMPVIKKEAFAFVLDSLAIVSGGRNGMGLNSAHTCKYDLAADTWTSYSIPSVPQISIGPSYVENGMGYVCSGNCKNLEIDPMPGGHIIVTGTGINNVMLEEPVGSQVLRIGDASFIATGEHFLYKRENNPAWFDLGNMSDGLPELSANHRCYGTFIYENDLYALVSDLDVILPINAKLIKLETDNPYFITPFADDFILTISADQNPFCSGDSTLVSSPFDSEYYTYQWMFNGEEIENATGPTLQATSPGNYMLVLTSGMQTVESNTLLILEETLPEGIPASIQQQIISCTSSPVELTAPLGDAPYTIQWSRNDVLLADTIASITINTNGFYQAVVTYGNSQCAIHAAEYEVYLDACDCVGDLNGDGITSIEDAYIFIAAIWQYGPNPADLNNDGIVDRFDMAIFINDFGSVCD